MQAAALLVFCAQVSRGQGAGDRGASADFACFHCSLSLPQHYHLIGGKPINRKQKLGKNPFLPSTQQASPCG